MQTILRTVSLFIAVCFMATLVHAGDQQPPAPQPMHKRKRIAVVKFEVPQSLYGSWGAHGTEAAARLGDVLADMMITALVKSGSFDVIEHTELERILKEQHLAVEGILDPATAPKAGKILGVDYILGGKLTEFGVKTNKAGGIGVITGGFLGVDLKKSTARAVIDARLIDTTTAKILMAEKATGENSETSLKFAGSDFGKFIAAIDLSSSEWTDSRIGRATRTAVDAVITKITDKFPPEANVRAVLPDGSIIIDMGRFSGIGNGDKFDLFRITPVTDEETGEVIFEERKLLGTATVAEMQEQSSKCTVTLLDAAKPAAKGDLVVLVKAKPAKPPQK